MAESAPSTIYPKLRVASRDRHPVFDRKLSEDALGCSIFFLGNTGDCRRRHHSEGVMEVTACRIFPLKPLLPRHTQPREMPYDGTKAIPGAESEERALGPRCREPPAFVIGSFRCPAERAAGRLLFFVKL